MNRPVILGLGNILFQDEGVGIHLVHQLMQEAIALKTEIIDGGTEALSLLGIVEAAEKLLVIDAISDSEPPGTVKVVPGEEVPLALALTTSVHQIGFQEVLALAQLRGRLPAQMVLIGVEPQTIGWGMELTPLIAEQLPRVKAMIYQQINNWLG